MIGIICKHGELVIPIMAMDNASMRLWDSKEEAEAFAMGNILCKASDVIYIDFDTVEFVE